MISNDGPKNIVDSVDYIASRVWADDEGRNRAGAVLIQEQRVFAARDVQKADARPGGYVATGGHGGILGGVGHDGRRCSLSADRHAHLSVRGEPHRAAAAGDGRAPRRRRASRRSRRRSRRRTARLLDTAVPKVAIVKDGSYSADDIRRSIPSRRSISLALIDHMLTIGAARRLRRRRAIRPTARSTSPARAAADVPRRHSGLPVVRVGRGNTEGFVPSRDPYSSAARTSPRPRRGCC